MRGKFKAAEGLTLIEVLVVTGIIGVLVCLQLTALTVSKASAGFITCKNRVRKAR